MSDSAVVRWFKGKLLQLIIMRESRMCARPICSQTKVSINTLAMLKAWLYTRSKHSILWDINDGKGVLFRFRKAKKGCKGEGYGSTNIRVLGYLKTRLRGNTTAQPDMEARKETLPCRRVWGGVILAHHELHPVLQGRSWAVVNMNLVNTYIMSHLLITDPLWV